jgi:DNA-binding Xre family transcriptional regulator
MPFSYKPLWVLLAQNDLKKQDLREALGLGPSTIAKMGKGENISLEVLDKLCSHFGVQPNDIIEHVAEPPQE